MHRTLPPADPNWGQLCRASTFIHTRSGLVNSATGRRGADRREQAGAKTPGGPLRQPILPWRQNPRDIKKASRLSDAIAYQVPHRRRKSVRCKSVRGPPPHAQAADALGSGHFRHQAPFGFHNREKRARRDVAQIGAKRELEAAAEGDPCTATITGTRSSRHSQMMCWAQLQMPCVRSARSANGKRPLPPATAATLSKIETAQKRAPRRASPYHP